MSKLILQIKAQEALDYLKEHGHKDFKYILSELQKIEKSWRSYQKFKIIWNWIKRVRVWRRRILCEEISGIIYVRIIAIEKDTKKDYDRWKNYIIKTRKN